MGNICRSPMAEAMFRHALPEKQFFSAGLDAPLGHAADAHACDLMRERGLDIGAHRARGIEGWMLLESDLILTMEKSHKDYLELRYPVTQGKVMRLGEALRCDIPDPYGKDRQAFEQACELIGATRRTPLAEMKRSYRKKVSECHPDKLAQQDLSDAEMAGAKERLLRYQQAWEIIKRHH